ELCKSVLNWPIEKGHSNTGKFVKGIKLRIPGVHDNIPTYDVWLSSRLSNPVTDKVTASDGSSDGSSDGLKPLPVKESDGCDGYSPNLLEILEEKKGLEIEEKTSTEPVQPVETTPVDKFAVPLLDEHYQLMKVNPLEFMIGTNFGDCKVTATPFKKIKSTGQSVVHLLYEMDFGRAVDQVKCVLGKKDVERLAKKSDKLKALQLAVAKKWQEKAKKHTFRVLKRGTLNEPDIWVENCTLVSVPHEHQHFFYLDAPDGTRFNASIGEFVVMK
ncbi:DNA primase, partial [Aphanizomenon flos-aquae CCAP 1446/1C]|nr:DNA primase [Anabaena sp. CCAP 1446/1C]